MRTKRRLEGSSPDVGLPKPKRRSKLSGEQLQRKRASDREAQRALREKTKNHVAHLESLVQSLQGGQDGRVERLFTQLDEQRAEITRLRAALTNISRIADATKKPFESAISEETPRCNEDTVIDHSNMDNDAQLSSGQFNEGMGDMGSDACPTNLGTASGPMQALNEFQVVEGTAGPSDLIFDGLKRVEDMSETEQNPKSQSIAQIASSIVRKKGLDGRFWFLAGTLLSYILKNQQGHYVHTAHDDDIAIRAVFEGWSAVIERYPLDRGWQWLKELDENIYFHLSAQHRLMHLRNSRLQLLHQIEPHKGWDQALPEFFAPRPSQLNIDHDPLLEHFPWPGFRERILFSPRKFATNHFMEALRKNVHFLWPYDIHDLYVKDTVSGLYSYSDTLQRQMKDIRCYTADRDFFINFPELRQDIPQNHPSPLALSTCLTIDSESPGPSEDDEARASASISMGT